MVREDLNFQPPKAGPLWEGDIPRAKLSERIRIALPRANHSFTLKPSHGPKKSAQSHHAPITTPPAAEAGIH